MPPPNFIPQQKTRAVQPAASSTQHGHQASDRTQWSEAQQASKEVMARRKIASARSFYERKGVFHMRHLEYVHRQRGRPPFRTQAGYNPVVYHEYGSGSSPRDPKIYWSIDQDTLRAPRDLRGDEWLWRQDLVDAMNDMCRDECRDKGFLCAVIRSPIQFKSRHRNACTGDFSGLFHDIDPKMTIYLGDGWDCLKLHGHMFLLVDRFDIPIRRLVDGSERRYVRPPPYKAVPWEYWFMADQCVDMYDHHERLGRRDYNNTNNNNSYRVVVESSSESGWWSSSQTQVSSSSRDLSRASSYSPASSPSSTRDSSPEALLPALPAPVKRKLVDYTDDEEGDEEEDNSEGTNRAFKKRPKV